MKQRIRVRSIVMVVGLLVVAALVWKSVNGLFRPALLQAAFDGELELIEEELADGAAANQEWRSASLELFVLEDADYTFDPSIVWEVETALYLAARQGHTEIVRRLLAAGADPNIECKEGTALTEAVRRRAPEKVVRLLLAAGAYPFPAVSRASQIGDWRVFLELRDAWAREGHLDTDRSKFSGYADSRDDAQRHAITELVRWNTEPSAAEQVARFGAAEELAQLQYAGADLTSANEMGWTPLHWAAGGWADEGALAKVELLLETGADPNALTRSGCSPLHMAAGTGDVAVAMRLIRAGANVRSADSRGWTPLHEATWWARPELVLALIAAGADLEAVDADGASAFDVADRVDSLISDDLMLGQSPAVIFEEYR